MNVYKIFILLFGMFFIVPSVFALQCVEKGALLIPNVAEYYPYGNAFSIAVDTTGLERGHIIMSYIKDDKGNFVGANYDLVGSWGLLGTTVTFSYQGIASSGIFTVGFSTLNPTTQLTETVERTFKIRAQMITTFRLSTGETSWPNVKDLELEICAQDSFGNPISFSIPLISAKWAGELQYNNIATTPGQFSGGCIRLLVSKSFLNLGTTNTRSIDFRTNIIDSSGIYDTRTVDLKGIRIYKPKLNVVLDAPGAVTTTSGKQKISVNTFDVNNKNIDPYFLRLRIYDPTGSYVEYLKHMMSPGSYYVWHEFTMPGSYSYEVTARDQNNEYIEGSLDTPVITSVSGNAQYCPCDTDEFGNEMTPGYCNQNCVDCDLDCRKSEPPMLYIILAVVIIIVVVLVALKVSGKI